MGEVDPLALSRWTRSTWMIHFLRYTCVILPSRPLNLPRITRTSSSLRTGKERVYKTDIFVPRFLQCQVFQENRLTLYLARSSLDNGADIIFLRTEEGAAKWAFRLLLLELETPAIQKHRQHLITLAMTHPAVQSTASTPLLRVSRCVDRRGPMTTHFWRTSYPLEGLAAAG